MPIHREPIETELYEKLRQRAREMRSQPTQAEQVLWQALRRRQLGGYRFRRQQPMLTYVVDFFCRQADLVVEVDGGIHQQQAGNDAARQAEIESMGFRVLRFANQEVLDDLPSVLGRVREALERG